MGGTTLLAHTAQQQQQQQPQQQQQQQWRPGVARRTAMQWGTMSHALLRQ
jgi:hypothetical protein